MNLIGNFSKEEILCSIEFKETKSANPTTLFFIHGSASTKATWNSVIEPLKPFYRIVAIDLRGHGDSPIRKGDFSVEQFSMAQMIKDVEEVVKSKNLGKFILVAHSMGIRIAVPYAAQHPEQIQALVLEDQDVLPRPKDILSDEKIHHLKSFKTIHDTEEEVKAELIKYDLGNRFDSWKLDGRIKQLPNQKFHITIHPYVTYLALTHISGSDETQKSFEKIKAPILFLRAEKFSCVSDKGLAVMQKMQPSMNYVYVPASEHSIHKSHPQIFLDAVNGFIQKKL